MSAIQFQTQESLQAFIIGLWLLVSAILIFRSYRRTNTRWLWARISLLCLALIALLLAALQPAYLTSKNPKAIILQTNNASAKVIDSLSKVFPDVELISSKNNLGALLAQRPEIQDLHIVGDGLRSEDLESIKQQSTYFYLNEAPEGFVQFHYTRSLKVGQDFELAGQYHLPSDQSVKLYLQSPQGKKELTDCLKSGLCDFQAAFEVKEAGRFLFQIIAEDANSSEIAKASFPVIIEPSMELKVLIINHAPNFETKYLKNWLADEGYPIAVRSAISREKYRTEFWNIQNLNLSRISQNLLQQFDLLIVQPAALENLSTTEQRNIRLAIEQGLGLCLMSPTAPKDWKFSNTMKRFLDFPIKTGASNYTFNATNNSIELNKPPVAIEDQLGVSALLRSESGQIVAAYQLKDAGKIALHLVPETYQLILGSQTKVYQRIWTDVLKKIARQASYPVQWQVKNELLTQFNFPLSIQLSYQGDLPTGQFFYPPDSLMIPFGFQQNPFNPSEWKATIWPNNTGWHQLSLQEVLAPQYWFYVPEAADWQSLRIHQQLVENKQWALEHPVKAQNLANDLMSSQAIPLYYFYILFLVAAGALWLEEKL